MTIRRAADDMGIVRKPPGGGRNCTWELPAEVIKALTDAEKEARKAAKSDKKGAK
jgi:hypothetical protein